MFLIPFLTGAIVYLLYEYLRYTPQKGQPSTPRSDPFDDMARHIRIPGILPPSDDKTINLLMEHCVDPDHLCLSTHVKVLKDTNPVLFQKSLDQACKLMIRHRDRLEQLRNIVAVNANSNHNALYRLRRMAYKGRMKIAPKIQVNAMCECADFLRVPCPLHPNDLNWLVKFSGCIGGKFVTRITRYSVSVNFTEKRFQAIREMSERVIPRGPYVPGYWKYVGPYSPSVYLKIFGGAIPAPVKDNQLYWDTESKDEKKKYDIPLIDYEEPRSSSPKCTCDILLTPSCEIHTHVPVPIMVDSVSVDGTHLTIQGHQVPVDLPRPGLSPTPFLDPENASDPFMGVGLDTIPELD